MIMGQPPTTPAAPEVPGVPGTAPPPIYRDPNAATKDAQDRMKRLRSWQAQNAPAPFQPTPAPTPTSAAPVAPMPLGTAPPPVRPTLPFNAANPRVY